MCQTTVEEQLQILKEVREEIGNSKERTLKFLKDAGILELIEPPRKYSKKKKKK